MAKKRVTKRKSAAVAAVENENEENIEDQETNSVTNGVDSSSSKSTPAKKKKSVTAKAEAKVEPPKNKAKSSKSKSEDDEDDADYEVEKIINVNYKKNGKRQFLIRWKNYSAKHDTWEPEDNLSCDELIEKFLLAEEQRDKQRKDLRERPKVVSRYTAPAGGRKSRRTAGTRKSYTEKEEDSE